MLGHATVRQIAAALGQGSSTIQRDIKAIRSEWQEHRLAAMDQALAEDLERLGIAEKAIWPAVIKGDLLAIDRLLRIMERRAKLLGLDAPKRIDITDRIRRLAEEAGLDPEEMAAEADRYVRMIAG